jgi:hypothetical protein
MTCNPEKKERRRPTQPLPFPALAVLLLLLSFLRLFPEQEQDKETMLWFSLLAPYFVAISVKPGQGFF